MDTKVTLFKDILDRRKQAVTEVEAQLVEDYKRGALQHLDEIRARIEACETLAVVGLELLLEPNGHRSVIHMHPGANMVTVLGALHLMRFDFEHLLAHTLEPVEDEDGD